ncbi:MAG: hypothetical protein ACKPKO_37570, partial [Candidatus Fonsibacter sp.]
MADKATISFKSSNITPLISDWSAKLAQHMICDVNHDFNPTNYCLPKPKLVGFMWKLCPVRVLN